MINLGILAHVDAGKTTLTERILHLTGAIRQAGSVDKGDAHTDNLPVERERGISVKACSARFNYKGEDVNLIDTPGHADFSGEIERSLRALDNAVLVLSAVEGVQAQTEVIWQAMAALEIPAICFINKIDRVGADAEKVVSRLRARFAVQPLPLNSERLNQTAAGQKQAGPSAAGLSFQPLADILFDPPVLEALAENDLAFMEKYLSAGQDPQSVLTFDEVLSALREQYRGRIIFPVLTGSALTGTGVNALLELLSAIAKRADTREDTPLSALVYRVEHHPALGKTAHVRMFGGALTIRDTVTCAGSGRQEKVAQLKQYSGVRLVDAQRLSAGDSGVVCGLSGCGVGDVYGSAEGVPKYYAMTQPLITVRLFPADDSQYPPLLAATRELNAEDPLLNMVWERELRELLLSVTGLIQIEILEHIYKTRFNLAVTFGEPTVLYKETPSSAGEGFEAYTMPKPCWAIIRFLIEPLPAGSGLVYESKIGPDALPLRYQAQIAQALPQALRQGPKGWEVTDLRVTLIAGESHVYHTHPLDFIVATPMALMNGLVNTGTDILEPYLSFTLSAPEALGPKLLGEINAIRGYFDETEIHEGVFTVRGEYPLAGGMDFPRRAAILTGGRGVLNTHFSCYKKCPYVFTQPYRGVSPLDKAKYILHIRHAL